MLLTESGLTFKLNGTYLRRRNIPEPVGIVAPSLCAFQAFTHFSTASSDKDLTVSKIWSLTALGYLAVLLYEWHSP